MKRNSSNLIWLPIVAILGVFLVVSVFVANAKPPVKNVEVVIPNDKL
ncbi:MAG: hypothetical protein AB7U85_01135 [Alphaproteobacteria bacterium]